LLREPSAAYAAGGFLLEDQLPKIDIHAITPRQGSGYPAPFHERAVNRRKRALGDAAGLTDFGVNLVTLPPGEWSSQRHWHTSEDELIYVLEGELTLITDAGERLLRAGDCAGFVKNNPDGHHLINKSPAIAVYLEVGTRTDGDECHYPDIDMHLSGGRFRHKDGTPYPPRQS
jgi:uncharacterized cupin superfamily protein